MPQLQAAASGDVGAQAHSKSVAELVQEHDRVLHAFLMSRLRDEHEAREVAQEAYVRLLNLAEPGAVSFLRAYLFKIASNLAVDRIKLRQLQARRVEIEATEEPVDELSPDRIVLSAEDIAVAKRALLELSPKCRRAFMLHRFEGWNAQQIADELGIQPRMVRRYVVRASVYCRLRVEGLSAEVARTEAHDHD